ELGFLPLEEFRVLARTITDAAGAFVFDGLPEGALELRVRPTADGAPVIAHVEGNAGECEVRLGALARESTTFFGSVRDGLDGRPLQRFTIAALPDGAGAGIQDLHHECADPSGHYEMAVPEAGSWDFVFQSPGYASRQVSRGAPGADRVALDVS